jgi:hypothetical protein
MNQTMEVSVIRIAVCGMGRERIATVARDAGGGQVETMPLTDFEAANAVKTGKADYYIGACQSGAGGALAVANALLGPSLVTRLAGPGGGAPDQGQVVTALDQGKKAFGVVHTQIDVAVPVIVGVLLRAAKSA